MKKSKKKTKILFVATFPPPVHGSAMMSKYIKESNLINEVFDCDYINLSTSRRMDEIGKKNISKFFRFVKSYLCLLCKLMTNRYALCYLAITCHGLGFIKDAPFVLLCKFFRRKIVIHQHNKGMSKDVNRQPYKLLLPLVYRSTKVILLSWYLYDDISSVVKKEDVFICPNGIPETFKVEPHFERNNEIPHILFLSNLIESKGVYVLLDALKILKDKGYNFICDFVGGETKEIDAKKFNEEVQKRGLNNLTIYHGRKLGEEKAEYFEQADIFTFPTYNDAFGLVNLEAMEYKLPIATTNEGGIPDIVKHEENGLISDKGNAKSLSANIGRLLQDKKLRIDMGEDGYKKLKSSFTIKTFEDNILEIVNKCYRGGVKYNLIFYHDKQYGADKEDFWNKANLFVFPTFYDNECFPLVLLEAMQHNVACISTNEGGIPEIIEDQVTGYIVGRRDILALADKLAYLIEHREQCRRMGCKGREKFEREFSLERFEERMLNLLDQIIKIN